MLDTGCEIVGGGAHKYESDHEGSRQPCEGEGETQYYTLPIHSGSQTAVKCWITETHVHEMHSLSFRILSLVLVTAASASIPTSSACMPSVFNNPFLFLQMQAAP